MKSFKRFLSVIMLVCLAVGCFAGCLEGSQSNTTTAPEIEHVDYVSNLKLDMDTETLKEEVTVKTFIDGDTVHFNISSRTLPSDVLKARFLAVNTPESTGKIEEYGKKASTFTKETLSAATSIIIETDGEKWEADSTGGRYLVWVWYRTSESEDYRNLNLEILQNGLAIASSSKNNRYGDLCVKAIAQAKAEKLNVYSGEKDPDFYYGEAQKITMKELRTNTESYRNTTVMFDGVVTRHYNNGVYVEEFDAETGLYYGMYIYYGFSLPGAGIEILAVGNRVRIVGSVQYYEAGGSWQVSDLSYRQLFPNDPGNIQKLGEGYTGAYTLTDPATFANSKVDVEVNGEQLSFDYAALALGTTVEMKNLKVTNVSVTDDEESSSYGAMTLTCEVDGVKISVRTNVFLDENGDLITADAFMGKTIDVKGIVDFFMGNYQIRVFKDTDITVH